MPASKWFFCLPLSLIPWRFQCTACFSTAFSYEKRGHSNSMSSFLTLYIFLFVTIVVLRRINNYLSRHLFLRHHGPWRTKVCRKISVYSFLSCVFLLYWFTNLSDLPITFPNHVFLGLPLLLLPLGFPSYILSNNVISSLCSTYPNQE